MEYIRAIYFLYVCVRKSFFYIFSENLKKKKRNQNGQPAKIVALTNKQKLLIEQKYWNAIYLTRQHLHLIDGDRENKNQRA